MNLFKDAAQYYKFRPEYPKEIIDLIKSKVGADGTANLLDIGCGTGSLCIPLSKYFKHVYAVDVDSSMIEEGKQNAANAGITNIEWILGDASALQNRFENVQAVTFGCSLHWFEGPKILKYVYDVLNDGGAVVATGIYTIWKSAPEVWQQKLLEIIKKYLGPNRMTLQGEYSRVSKPKGTTNKFIDFFQLLSFKDSEVIEFELPERILNVDDIVGYQFSTSYAAPELFKEKRSDFEIEVKKELLKIQPDNKFREKTPGFVTLGWK